MSTDSSLQSSGRHACAACKHQRKKCGENCVMAPHFPASRAEDFQSTHRVFGFGNMSKMLMKLDDEQKREEAVKSYIWEASMWKQDPVYGPLGQYQKLETELELLRIRNQLLRNELNRIREFATLPNCEAALNSAFSGVFSHSVHRQQEESLRRDLGLLPSLISPPSYVQSPIQMQQRGNQAGDHIGMNYTGRAIKNDGFSPYNYSQCPLPR